VKILIDTNVLISAVLKDRDPELVLLFIVSHPEFEWIASPEIYQEYQEVLSRKKFNLPKEILNKWFKILENIVIIFQPNTKINFPRDQNDAKFLSCAVSADAHFFITGDHDFSEAKKLIETTIISVSQFKRLFC